MKKFFRIALWVLVALVFVGTFYFLWRNSQTPEDSYATVRPTLQTIERTTVLTGKIEPRDEIEIKPQISGIVSEILVEAGQQVNAGDVLVVLEAMKMEIEVSAPVAGTVKSVSATVGGTVNTDDLLVVLG